MLPDWLGGFHSAQLRHGDIHDHDVELRLQDLLRSLPHKRSHSGCGHLDDDSRSLPGLRFQEKLPVCCLSSLLHD